MKTNFAKEKSEYAHCLKKCINDALSIDEGIENIIRIKELENIVIEQGDELIFIVTTVKTNPMKDKTAAPMSMENIKNA